MILRFAAIRKGITARKPISLQLALTICGVGLAALGRLLTDQGVYGVPFATYIPMIMLITIFCDWRWGVLATVTSMVIVASYFRLGSVEPIGTARVFAWGAASLSAGFLVFVGHCLRQTIIQLDRQSLRVEEFNRELQHRSRNTLQIIRALASQARKASDPDSFYQALVGRLDAMARAGDLLGTDEQQSCEIRELVGKAIEPFGSGAIAFNGPPCRIEGEAGRSLMMALHELGTNAVKYGALSSPDGAVEITWVTADERIEITWVERGGPAVVPPSHRGVGSRLLTPSLALPVVELVFAPTGVVCRISAASTG